MSLILYQSTNLYILFLSAESSSEGTVCGVNTLYPITCDFHFLRESTSCTLKISPGLESNVQNMLPCFLNPNEINSPPTKIMPTFIQISSKLLENIPQLFSLT